MKSLITAIFIICNIFTLHSQTINDNHIVKIVEEAEWYPFTFEKSGIPSKGIALELMNLIFTELNIKFEMSLYPQNRIIHKLKNGDVDMISILSRNIEREKYFDYTDPIFEERGIIYFNKVNQKEFQWTNFRELSKYRIGLVSGYNYGSAFHKAMEKYNYNIDYAITTEQNFLKLKAGRIDIVLTTESTGKKFLKNHKEYSEFIKGAEKPYLVYSFCSAFSKKSNVKYLIPRINRIIKDLLEQNEIEMIFDKYSVPYRSPTN